MANILITGANGKIATAIIEKKIKDNNLFLFSRDKLKLEEKYGQFKNVQCFFNSEIENFNETLDIILHCAFERSSDETRLIEAQKLSVKFFNLAKKCLCKRFINLSSQAVYSAKVDVAPKEVDNPYPFDLYGTLKLSTEKILENTLDKKNYIHIRLTALAGKNYPAHILSKMVNFAIVNREIKVLGENQNFAFMHFKDAIDALLILFDLNIKPKYNIYNLGNNEQYNIFQMAQAIKKQLKKQDIDIGIDLVKSDRYLNSQLNSNRFMKEFNWQAKYSLDDIIKEIIDNYI